MKKLVLAAAVAMAFVPASLVMADEGEGYLTDQIFLNLTKEGWVTTDSARVFVHFDITQQKETATELKTEIMKSLSKLSSTAVWHVTSSRESKDRTGLTRWSVGAEARIEEKSISGLSDRAEDAGRPGFKMRISHVDYSPSLEETERLRSELRTKIYEEAQKEAARLNKVITGREYRIYSVDFSQMNGPVRSPRMEMRAQPMIAKSMDSGVSSVKGGGEGAQLPVSRKHSLSAHIVLTSTAAKK
ncbi:MAG: SIMPL domain-containing protein [Sneathiellales bacterium]|nr:SIMPL domain-containing protein [Sneathiellales bacterium]